MSHWQRGSILEISSVQQEFNLDVHFAARVESMGNVSKYVFLHDVGLCHPSIACPINSYYVDVKEYLARELHQVRTLLPVTSGSECSPIFILTFWPLCRLLQM